MPKMRTQSETLNGFVLTQLKVVQLLPIVNDPDDDVSNCLELFIPLHSGPCNVQFIFNQKPW